MLLLLTNKLKTFIYALKAISFLIQSIFHITLWERNILKKSNDLHAFYTFGLFQKNTCILLILFEQHGQEMKYQGCDIMLLTSIQGICKSKWCLIQTKEQLREQVNIHRAGQKRSTFCSGSAWRVRYPDWYATYSRPLGIF